MSRRALVSLAVSGVLLAAALPFLGSASAAACPSWTDPAGDAASDPAGVTADDSVDITAVQVEQSATAMTVTFTVPQLDTANTYTPGDRFELAMTANDAPLSVISDRYDAGFADRTGVVVGSTITAGGSVKYDVAAHKVVLAMPYTVFDTALAKKFAGMTLKALNGGVRISFGPLSSNYFDRAAAPTTLTLVAGAACGGGDTPAPVPTTTSPAPSPSPSPSPSPTTGGSLPVGYPTAGCVNFADDKGDGSVGSQEANVKVAPNDPDLDVTGVAIQSGGDALKVFVKVDALKATPSAGIGNAWVVDFTYGGKEVELYATFSPTDAANPFSAPFVSIDGNADDTVTMTVVQDTANSFVVFTVDRAKLEKAIATKLASGTALGALTVESGTYVVTGYEAADAAAPPASAPYQVGDDHCFGPPPGKLLNVGRTSVQYTDAASLATKLTDAAGKPLAGKTVSFAIGAARTSARTGSDGVARASLNPGVTAGSYSLVTSFAGDGSAGKVDVTTPFTVTTEATKIVLSVKKNGAKRTVVATLLDDDGHALAGQTVTWYLNGKKVSSATTNAAGVVTLATAKPTQTVVAEFLAVAGKYNAAKATSKV